MKSALQKILYRYPRIKYLSQKLVSTIPLSLRISRHFWEWYSFFEESEYWDFEIISEFQLECLKELLSELKTNSTYYQDILSDIDIHQINSLEDFRLKVPTITRSDFKTNYNRILNSTWRSQKVSLSQTSGTTGSALQFYHLDHDNSREWAAICHQWKRVGFDPINSRRVEFRGLTAQRQLVEWSPHRNMMRCSILNLKKPHIIHYSDEIRKSKMDFFHGYPSALYLLSSEIIQGNIDFPQPKAILLASEIVYDWQVACIEEAFPKSTIFAHYGCAERTVLAGWCEYRREYHVLPQYGLIEVDDKTSEIIGTNLFNYINGFVRYQMKDTALKLDTSICPDCNRPYIPRLIELGGRLEDFLFSPENGWISPAIITYPLKSLKEIREIQFYQREKNEICIRYTNLSTNKILLAQDLEKIKMGMKRLFGSSTSIKLELVEDLQRGTSGKFKWIICDLDEKPHA